MPVRGRALVKAVGSKRNGEYIRFVHCAVRKHQVFSMTFVVEFYRRYQCISVSRSGPVSEPGMYFPHYLGRHDFLPRSLGSDPAP